MRGSMRSRHQGSWTMTIEGGYQPDPQTGKLKRKQHTYTIRGSKRDAEKKLHELVTAANRGELVKATRLTLVLHHGAYDGSILCPSLSRRGERHCSNRPSFSA